VKKQVRVLKMWCTKKRFCNLGDEFCVPIRLFYYRTFSHVLSSFSTTHGINFHKKRPQSFHKLSPPVHQVLCVICLTIILFNLIDILPNPFTLSVSPLSSTSDNCSHLSAKLHSPIDHSRRLQAQPPFNRFCQSP
jgi:hypothetical protein